MKRKFHVRCEAGEKMEIISKSYLLLLDQNGKWDGKAAATAVTQTPDTEDIINPIEGFDTIEEAQKALKFKVTVPKELLGKYNIKYINVILNEIIQVKYNDGNNNITFRAGKSIDNISGDYNVYQVKNTAKVNGINITLEGNKSKEYNLATWEKDGISYSISAKNGIDEKIILDMVL